MSYWDTEPYLGMVKRAGVAVSPVAKEKIGHAIVQAMEDAYHMGQRNGAGKSGAMLRELQAARAEGKAEGMKEERKRCAEIVRGFADDRNNTPPLWGRLLHAIETPQEESRE